MPRLWIDTNFDDNITTSVAVLKSLMTGVSAAQTRFDQMTLLRTIIGFNVGRLTHDSGEGSEIVSVGIGLASQEAFAAGSVSDPETPTDFPIRGWVWRGRYRIFGFAADDPTIFTQRIDLDLRAKRRLENGETFLNATLANIEGTNSTARLDGIVRQLWLVS